MSKQDEAKEVTLSKYRFEQAERCLRSAKLLLEDDDYRGAANRFYYWIYNAIRSIFALDGVEFRRHSGNTLIMTDNRAVAVGIMDGNEDVYLEYTDVNDYRVDEHTLFELGSTTKAFTGLGILHLESEGLININDPVTKYIDWFRPQYKGADAVVTIYHLVNHSSGISVWSISFIPEGSKGETSLEKTVRKIADIRLAHAPGQVHEYATINYDVLPLIIEKVTGQKYEDYITNTILCDVEMSESFFRTADSDRNRIIPGCRDGFIPINGFACVVE
ncbi:MAG: serine hydrolase [Lachnospiraceae bacterium]|nr:serine hydrolase [Lachnospiraceae bacterium]